MAVPQDARLATLTGQFDSIERRLVALEVAAGLNPGKAGPRPEDEPLEQQLGAEASPTQLRLAQDLLSRGVTRFAFRRVPGSYYSWPLEGRRGALDAATVHHLCVPWTGGLRAARRGCGCIPRPAAMGGLQAALPLSIPGQDAAWRPTATCQSLLPAPPPDARRS